MAQVKDIIVIREAIERITKILAGRGIKVTQQGMRAFVEHTSTGVPVRVNLPYIPDSATPELINAIHGFLDHEVGHLLMSDFGVLAQSHKEGKSIGVLTNILEDTFVERQMTKRFMGSEHNLNNVREFFLRKYTDPKVKEAIAKGDMKEMINALSVPAARAWAGQEVFKKYMEDKWALIKPYVDKVGPDLIERIAKINSTSDSLDIAREMRKRLAEAGGGGGGGDEGESEADDDGDDSDESGDSGESPTKGGKHTKRKPGKDKSKNEGESEEESKPKPKKEKSEDKDESEGEDEGEKDKDESEDEEESESKPEKDESEGEDEGESEDDSEGEGESEPGDGESTSEESSGEPPPTKPTSSPPLIDDDDLEKLPDFDEAAAGAISDEASKAATAAPYLIFSKDFDKIGTFEPPRSVSEHEVAELQKKTDHMVGTLQKNLERIISARSVARWQPGLRRGRINGSSLYRIKTGDTRVFRKKEMGYSKDVAVSLVVDCSGSMSGSPIELAMVSAYAMSSVLDRLNIANEVIGFTTKGWGSGISAAVRAEIDKDEARMGRSFSRVEPIHMPIFKHFHERMLGEQRKRFAAAPHGIRLANNIDGESIENAAYRLARRKEAGKYMFVLSDGFPAAHGDYYSQVAHLKHVTKTIMPALGIKAVGIGIMSDAVQHFYPKWVVLNDLDELPSKVMKELRGALLGD